MKNVLCVFMLAILFSQCKKSTSEPNPDPAALIAGNYGLTLSRYGTSSFSAFTAGKLTLQRIDATNVNSVMYLEISGPNIDTEKRYYTEVWNAEQVAADSVILRQQSIDGPGAATYVKNTVRITADDGMLHLRFTKQN